MGQIIFGIPAFHLFINSPGVSTREFPSREQQTIRAYKTAEEQQSGYTMLQQFIQERAIIRLARRDSLLLTFTSPEQ